MNFKETYRSNDKLIRKSLYEELPDLNISPTVKLAIMEHVNKKVYHKWSLLLLLTGIAASLLVAFFLRRTTSMVNNNDIPNPKQIVIVEKKQKHFHDKYNSLNSKDTSIIETPLNKNPHDNHSFPIMSQNCSQINRDTATTNTFVHDTIFIQLDPVRSFDNIYLAMTEDFNKLEMEYQKERTFSMDNKMDICPSYIDEKQCDTLFFDSVNNEMEIFEKELLDSRQYMIF